MALDGLLRKVDERRGVAASGNGVVVVSGEDHEAFPSRERHRLGGKRAIADDVAKAYDLLGAAGPRIGEDILERRKVGVDV